jgi:hypothetical protein
MALVIICYDDLNHHNININIKKYCVFFILYQCFKTIKQRSYFCNFSLRKDWVRFTRIVASFRSWIGNAAEN